MARKPYISAFPRLYNLSCSGKVLPMDKINTYLKNKSLVERDAIAERARKAGLACSGGHLTQIAGKHRVAQPPLVKFLVNDAGRHLKKSDGLEYIWENA